MSEEAKVKSIDKSSMKDILRRMRESENPTRLDDEYPQGYRQIREDDSDNGFDFGAKIQQVVGRLPQPEQVESLPKAKKAAIREAATEVMVHTKSLFSAVQALIEATK